MSADQTDMVDALVIFGATGDLAKKETFPALVGLVARGVLDVPVIGVAKSGWGLDQFRDYATASLKLNNIDPGRPAAVKLLQLLRYVDGDLDDPATYRAMSDQMGQAQQVLFYLEVPPPLFGRIAEGISQAGRAKGSRVMVEKPFGNDLASAQQLNATMHAATSRRRPSTGSTTGWAWRRSSSLMFVRFANSIIEPLLNREHVQSIQITMAEAFDVADRGSFYDKTGAIRDVIQNHMLQVLATVLAEPPDGTGLDSWRESKSQLIGGAAPADPGTHRQGPVRGLPPGRRGGTRTRKPRPTWRSGPTADSWRWADVPILIRAGKCLPVTATEVTISFRRPPYDAFGLGHDGHAAGTPCGSGSTRGTGSASPWSARSPARAGCPRPRSSTSPNTPAPTCAPTTGSSAPRSTGSAGCSPRRTRSRRPGGSSTPCSAM